MVAVLKSHPTDDSVSSIAFLAMHLQSRQSERFTRNGQGLSKMTCRISKLKGNSGSFIFFKEKASPSYEKISLSNCPLAKSPSIIDIFFGLSAGAFTLISRCSLYALGGITLI